MSDKLIESAKVDLSSISNLSSSDILQNYIVTLLASLLLLRIEDSRIVHILRDPNNKRLSRYRRDMSPLNYWGFILNHPDHKDLKTFIDGKTAKTINRASGRILNSSWRYIHTQISDHPRNIDWPEMMDQVRIITLRLNMRMPKINDIRNSLSEWDSLDSLDRSSAVSKTFLLMSQHDRNNILLSRLRNISTTVLTNPVKKHSDINNDNLVNTISDIKRGVSNINKMSEHLLFNKCSNGKKIVLRVRDFNRISKISKKRTNYGDKHE